MVSIGNICPWAMGGLLWLSRKWLTRAHAGECSGGSGSDEGICTDSSQLFIMAARNGRRARADVRTHQSKTVEDRTHYHPLASGGGWAVGVVSGMRAEGARVRIGASREANARAGCEPCIKLPARLGNGNGNPVRSPD